MFCSHCRAITILTALIDFSIIDWMINYIDWLIMLIDFDIILWYWHFDIILIDYVDWFWYYIMILTFWYYIDWFLSNNILWNHVLFTLQSNNNINCINWFFNNWLIDYIVLIDYIDWLIMLIDFELIDYVDWFLSNNILWNHVFSHCRAPVGWTAGMFVASTPTAACATTSRCARAPPGTGATPCTTARRTPPSGTPSAGPEDFGEQIDLQGTKKLLLQKAAKIRAQQLIWLVFCLWFYCLMWEINASWF